MMKKNYFFIALFFVAFNLFAQPTRKWGTYYGDTGNEWIHSIATATNEEVLVCGYSTSTMNIASPSCQQVFNAGSEDAFVARFDSAGNRLWATYFGGPNDERANFICLDGNGNIYIAGSTSSSISIGTAGCHQQVYSGGTDAFLAKYDNTGVLQWATYYGGSGAETGWSVAVDGVGNIYLVGLTSSTNNISTPGSHQVSYGGGTSDAFIAKFNSAGVRQWGTYYGGTVDEDGLYIATAPLNNIYFTGRSNSLNAISTPGCHQSNLDGGIQEDAYLAKFDGSGTRLWATYYGGSASDDGRGVAVDQSGNVYLAGTAYSFSNISTPGCHQFTQGGNADGFLVKFNSSGVRQWGTYYGGSSSDSPHYLGVDTYDNIFLAGDELSSNGISTPGSHQPIFGGVIDGFAAKFNSIGVRQWGTYYGGTAVDRGFSMCMDQIGNIYLGGLAGSTNAISTPSCYQFTSGGGMDAYLVRFADCAGTPDPGIVGPTVLCVGAGATVYSVALVALSYTWVLPGGWSGSSSTNTISATPGSSGIFSVTASNMCGTGSQTLNVMVSGLPTITVNSGSICSGNSFTMVPGGASTYTFEGGSAVVSPTANSSYTVIGTSSVGCVSQTYATSTITVNVLPLPTITVNSGSICSGQSFTMVAGGANTYTFQGGNSIVSPTVNSSYTVIGTNTSGCVSSSAAVSNITVSPLPTINAASNNSLLCVGETATLTATGASNYTWNPGGSGVSIVISPTLTSNYTVTGTDFVTGCSNFTVITQNVSLCIGSKKLINSTGLFIFPNPNKGTFKIKIDNEINNGELILINSLGQKVHEQKIMKGENEVITKVIPVGLYHYIILQSKEQVANGKIIIESDR